MKFKKEYLFLFLIITTTIIAYSNIFTNEFVWDDKTFIIDWKTKNSFKNIPQLLSGDEPDGHEGVYGPVRGIIYTLSYKLFGENPLGYHIQSLIVHIIATLLIYFIIKEITNIRVGFLTALFFGIHPIHTESISFITASFDVIGILFFLFSFYLYIKNKLNWSLLMAFFAFFTHEITLTLPFLIILYDICFNKKGLTIIKKNYRKYSAYFSIAIIYIFIRFFILNIVGRGEYFGNIYHVLLAIIKSLYLYIYLMIWPLNLNINRLILNGVQSSMVDMDPTSVLSISFLSYDILGALFVLILIGIISIFAYKKNKIIFFSILWFFIALLPVLNIVPIQSIFNERYLYIPSIAFAFLLGYFVNILYKKQKILAISIIIILVFSYIPLTLSRNLEWHDELIFWSSAERKNPTSFMINYNLANTFDDEGMVKEAIQSYEKSIELNPWQIKARNNLIKTLIDSGEYGVALKTTQEALNYNPDMKTFNHLGVIFLKKEDYENAENAFEKAIDIYENNANAYSNLGYIFFTKGDINNAIKYYETSLEINPDQGNIQETLKILEQR